MSKPILTILSGEDARRRRVESAIMDMLVDAHAKFQMAARLNTESKTHGGSTSLAFENGRIEALKACQALMEATFPCPNRP